MKNDRNIGTKWLTFLYGFTVFQCIVCPIGILGSLAYIYLIKNNVYGILVDIGFVPYLIIILNVFRFIIKIETLLKKYQPEGYDFFCIAIFMDSLCIVANGFNNSIPIGIISIILGAAVFVPNFIYIKKRKDLFCESNVAIDGRNTIEPKTYRSYKCGNCGRIGPYDGNCPNCGHSVKINFDVIEENTNNAEKKIEENMNISKSEYYFEDVSEFASYVKYNNKNDVVWLKGDKYKDLYIECLKAFELTKYDQVISLCKKALVYNPIGIGARFEMCEAYIAKKDLINASKVLLDMTDFLTKKGQIAKFYRRLGYIETERHNYKLALACYLHSRKFEDSPIVMREVMYIISESNCKLEQIDAIQELERSYIPVIGLPEPIDESKLNDKDETKNLIPAYCRKCGRKLVVGSLYCHICGTKIQMKDENNDLRKM